ncbi:UNVERIFIED_CONTAM: hypothetical protein Slati_1266400 [Sesamum latifolium]|uniref:Uncharacterized protein n=1 Tax=Sesamum latifolium TaxID=2727402 RepID=A0AAW2XGH1_9LAMI
MSVSLQIVRCFSAVSLSSSSLSSSSQSGAAPVRISCSVQEALPSQIKPPPPPPTTHHDKRLSITEADSSSRSGIKLPRQRYISVSKCLDSILHAEHKTILEEMRADFDATLSTKSNRFSPDGFPSFARKDVANQESSAPLNNSKSDDKEQEDKADTEMLMSSDFTRDLKQLFDFSFKTAKRSPIKRSRVAIPGRFERAFMKLLCNAEFEELSPRDLMLTSALNTDYLLTLPIYIDWEKASESNAIIFRRGYATERQKGLLIAEKLDYLQSKLLQNIFALIAKPLGKFGVWLNEVFKSIMQKQDTEVLDNKLMLWLKELSLSLKPQSYDQISDNLKGVDILSSDRPIWEAAQKAVTRYEGILSEVGPRERLLRKFLAWIGLVPSTPEQAFDFNLDCTGPESNLSPSFLSRISLGDIWKPASPKSCGNDFRKMLSTAISILFSQSILQVTSTRTIGDKCETFIYNVFKEKVEMPVDKAIDTLMRLGLVIKKAVDGEIILQAMPCSRACIILRDRWNSLIN